MVIDDKTIEAIRQLAERYGLRLMLLFGSAVSGVVHAASDIDIAVMFTDREAAVDRYTELHGDLQELFPERSVDLALINGADPLFLKKIMENCMLLYGGQRDLAELKMYAFRRYIDHRKYLKMEGEYIERLLARLKRGAA